MILNRSLIAWLLLASVACAEVVVLQIGQTTYVIRAGGKITVERADRIIDLDGDVPPPPPDPDVDDQLGLIAIARAAVANVPAYPDRERDAARWSAAYGLIAQQIDEGKITSARRAASALSWAVSAVLADGTDEFRDAWKPFTDKMKTALRDKTSSSTSLADTRQAIAEIAAGVNSGGKSSAAWGDGTFLKFLIEVLLPLLLKLFGGITL